MPEKQDLPVSNESQEAGDASSPSATPAIAIVFYVAAVGLAAYGLFFAHQDIDSHSSVVNGDAFNYMIFAARGTAMVGASIVIAIIGLACQISGHIAHLLSPKPNDIETIQGA